MQCRFCSNGAEYTVEISVAKNGEEGGKKFIYICKSCLNKWEQHGVDICRCGNRYVREDGEYKEVHIPVCELCDKNRSPVHSAQEAVV